MTFPLVKVSWVDSQQSSGWCLLNDLRHEVLEIESIGWIVHEDDDIIQITAHLGSERGGLSKQICGHMTIPKCAITARENLTHD